MSFYLCGISPTVENIIIPCGKSLIRGIKSGHGEELLIAIHGYGDRAVVYMPMVRKYPGRFTVYAIDLPLHGKSDWQKRQIDGDDFVVIVQSIMDMEKVKQVSLMGFSMGCRVVMHLIEHIPNAIQNVYMIGPDGISNAGLYRTVQKIPDFMKRGAFKMIANKYTASFAKHLYRRGWMNHHSYRFCELNFTNRDKRRQLKLYWLSLGRFSPDWENVKKVITRHQIGLHVYLGTQDEVIPSRAGKMLTDGIDNAEVVFLNANHRKLQKVFFQRVGDLL